MAILSVLPLLCKIDCDVVIFRLCLLYEFNLTFVSCIASSSHSKASTESFDSSRGCRRFDASKSIEAKHVNIYGSSQDGTTSVLR